MKLSFFNGNCIKFILSSVGMDWFLVYLIIILTLLLTLGDLPLEASDGE